MAERPILFSAPLVRAILAGRKTETRRLIKPLPTMRKFTRFDEELEGWAWDCKAVRAFIYPGIEPEVMAGCAPISKRDELYVREAWALHFLFGTMSPKDARGEDPDSVFYRANGEDAGSLPVPVRPKGTTRAHIDNCRCTPSQREKRWRPSIHMPKWASRIRLRVTEVRAERLQAIDETGAKAEGIMPDARAMTAYEHDNRPDSSANGGQVSHVDEYRPAFQRLWTEINGRREGAGWAEDPWVWVYKFEVIEVRT